MPAHALAILLANAKSSLASEEGWIPNEYAADADGHWKPVGSRQAVRFSLWGAIMRHGASREQLSEVRTLIERLEPALASKARAGKLTFAETHAIFDSVIRALHEPAFEREAPTLPSNAQVGRLSRGGLAPAADCHVGSEDQGRCLPSFRVDLRGSPSRSPARRASWRMRPRT